MSLKKYITESERAQAFMVEGDVFTVGVNEELAVEFDVVSHTDNSVVVEADDFGLKVLEHCGCQMIADEEVTEGRLGFRDLEMFGSEIASRIDQEARRRGSADMEPGDADQLRYMIAREMGLVEDAVNEDREVMVRATNIDYDGPALDKLPTDVNVKVMVNPGDSEDEIFDMVADELEDRYGVKVSGFDMKMMEDQDIEEDEDIIGNIIGKLAQPKVGSKGGKDVIGDIIAKLPKDSDEKTVNMPSLPKSKPERTPTVSAVAQQAAANKAVRSMAQDTTRPLRQSKFSEWSKK